MYIKLNGIRGKAVTAAARIFSFLLNGYNDVVNLEAELSPSCDAQWFKSWENVYNNVALLLILMSENCFNM